MNKNFIVYDLWKYGILQYFKHFDIILRILYIDYHFIKYITRTNILIGMTLTASSLNATKTGSMPA
jgi:hypothetical protein